MTLNNAFIKSLNILDGIITFNDFEIEENIPFEQQKYSFKEDLLQIKFGDRFILDVSWRPEFEKDGNFIICAIQDNDWIHPLSKIECTTFNHLKKAIEKTAIFINKKRMTKNLAYRTIEYDE